MGSWSEADDKKLRERYDEAANQGMLSELAKELGRTKAALNVRAFKLGMTTKRGTRPKYYARVWKGMTEEEARPIFEKFKSARRNVTQFCTKHGYDDLGFSRTMQEHFPDEWDVVVESKQCKLSKYRLGRYVEYRVRDSLRKLGYFVLRSPRSKGPVDLVALKRGVVILLQCKRSMVMGVAEWNAIYRIAESIGAIAVVAGTPTGKGTVYQRLLGEKDGSKRRQPMEPFTP